MGAEVLGDRGDGRDHPRVHGVAGLGVLDGVAEDGVQRQGAVVAQQGQPGADGARDRRGEEAGSGDQLEVQFPEGVDRRSGGGGPPTGPGGGGAGPRRGPAVGGGGAPPGRDGGGGARPRPAPASPLAKGRGPSPPGPLRWGSPTWRASPPATAASKALPPLSRTAIPAAVASQWVEATMPKVPASSGRGVDTRAQEKKEPPAPPPPPAPRGGPHP